MLKFFQLSHCFLVAAPLVHSILQVPFISVFAAAWHSIQMEKIYLIYMEIVIKLKEYLRGAVEELRKVTWPTKKQTQMYTFLVIAMVVGVAFFFGILDYIFNLGLEFIIR